MNEEKVGKLHIAKLAILAILCSKLLQGCKKMMTFCSTVERLQLIVCFEV